MPRGKHLLIRLADGRTLRTHFRMDGSWHIYRPGTKWRGGPAYDVRVVLATDEWECVGYRLHDIDDRARPPTRTGWSATSAPTSSAPTGTSTRRCAGSASTPTSRSASRMLDQRNLAGIGNLYKVESLFLRGVHPWTRVADVARPARRWSSAPAR